MRTSTSRPTPAPTPALTHSLPAKSPTSTLPSGGIPPKTAAHASRPLDSLPAVRFANADPAVATVASPIKTTALALHPATSSKRTFLSSAWDCLRNGDWKGMLGLFGAWSLYGMSSPEDGTRHISRNRQRLIVEKAKIALKPLGPGYQSYSKDGCSVTVSKEITLAGNKIFIPVDLLSLRFVSKTRVLDWRDVQLFSDGYVQDLHGKIKLMAELPQIQAVPWLKVLLEIPELSSEERVSVFEALGQLAPRLTSEAKREVLEILAQNARDTEISPYANLEAAKQYARNNPDFSCSLKELTGSEVTYHCWGSFVGLAYFTYSLGLEANEADAHFSVQVPNHWLDDTPIFSKHWPTSSFLFANFHGMDCRPLLAKSLQTPGSIKESISYESQLRLFLIESIRTVADGPARIERIIALYRERQKISAADIVDAIERSFSNEAHIRHNLAEFDLLLAEQLARINLSEHPDAKKAAHAIVLEMAPELLTQSDPVITIRFARVLDHFQPGWEGHKTPPKSPYR